MSLRLASDGGPLRISSMTDVERKIVVAEESGYKRISPNKWRRPNCNSWTVTRRGLPDTQRSLDAMHTAWATLTRDEHDKFRFHLRILVLNDPGYFDGPCRSLSNAPARLRQIAFLLAKGYRL